MNGFIIAAPSSGSGKTTVAALLCLALRARGHTVQAFKLGPDYLDPTHLSWASGSQARNLDSFLLPSERLQVLFRRACTQAEIAVVEGVMGLYDGRDPESDEHSTAALSRLLKLPVVLVIDASGMARSVAAVACGLRDFGLGVRVAGVILNRVGSVRHAELCAQALAQAGLTCLGFVLRDTALQLPSRQLGLLRAEQQHWDSGVALQAAQHLELAALLRATALPERQAAPLVTAAARRGATIAYAHDAAFHFYYPDALDELRYWGARLVPFSPLHDAGVPPEAGGLLLGGGYPEAHAAQLAANTSMVQSIRAFAASGRAVVAECGGLMYLAESLEDLDGQRHQMCGVIPYRTRMTGRLSLGYRDAQALVASPLLPAQTQIPGHEFHYSALTHAPTHPAYRWTTPAGQDVLEGYAQGNVVASYLHLHYGGYPAVARRLVALSGR